MTIEVINGSATLDGTEQVIGSTTAFHPRVSVYVPASNQKGAAKSVWRVYAISDGVTSLLATGVLQDPSVATILLADVPSQGATVKLTVQAQLGSTAVPVAGSLVGWDPGDSITPATAFGDGTVTLTNAEQDVCTLGAAYTLQNVNVNPNADPKARKSIWRLYAVVNSVRYLLASAQVFEILKQQALIQNVVAGAESYVLTAQGGLGDSAINVTGVIFGSTDIAAGGGGGGGTLAGDVTGPIGSNIAVKLTGAAGVLAVAATAAIFTWAAGTVTPGVTQAAATSDVATQSLTIQAQTAFSGATVHTTGGDLFLLSGFQTPGLGNSGGAIHFQVSPSTDALTIAGTGIVTAVEAIQSPEFVVLNVGIGRTPVIISGTGVPSVSGPQPGSLFLSNEYNALYVQNESDIWNPIAQLDASGFLGIDPTTANFQIYQSASLTGAGTLFRIISQPALAASTNLGGDVSFILGNNDPSGQYPATGRFFYFGMQTAPDGNETSGNYTGMLSLEWNVGGVVIANLGRGANGIGSGVAGNEISAFAELSIATENHVPINNIIAGVGPTSTFLEITDHDTTDEAAWSLAYFANHATSGDVAGVQILYTETAIGSGQARYLDIQKGGVRQFDIRPNPGLTGAILSSTGFLYVQAGTVQLSGSSQVQLSSAQVQVANAGSIGWDFLMGSTDLNWIALASSTSVTINFQDTSSAGAAAKIAIHGQNNTGAGAGGAFEFGPGTGGTHGILSIVNIATATTVGAAGGASALPALPVSYLPITVAGTALKIPLYNV